ncbi:hypothetical protein DDB_G0290911 [Dictyostelium discoideum AX4]|uniref:Uncharacterized transmembrane protein DDB_G0290911 n=1 Tax=Dictyostelium discoideum TaxID=44689 RepID=Y9147_DICDI|nr:hypothetical protein DDB_G0290911 [Dictyostelium discoideum AX4]Q54FE7.1 RecName: Full=Uncharacterized transmembrane protein DDB_G0290911 [Dictyostelium discoideum]EAL61971.1 hypothetical protein DDB_G0290911 [Dictyostelium discoideum AX4]|eukprot:XP_635475.1 hypothetical protein DDB_G0290911 [Dictyostelium discoideum AX4]
MHQSQPQQQIEEYKQIKKLLFLVGLTIGKMATSRILSFLGFINCEIKLK